MLNPELKTLLTAFGLFQWQASYRQMQTFIHRITMKAARWRRNLCSNWQARWAAD